MSQQVTNYTASQKCGLRLSNLVHCLQSRGTNTVVATVKVTKERVSDTAARLCEEGRASDEEL